jgi:hypothetical protein
LHDSYESWVVAHDARGVSFPPSVLEQDDAAWAVTVDLAITERSFNLASQDEHELPSWRWMRRAVPSGRNTQEGQIRNLHEGGQLHRRRGRREIGQGHGNFYFFAM